MVALIVAAVAYNGLRRAEEFGAAADRSGAIGAALSGVMLALDDAETGQRGFLLTGDSSYLAPFERGKATVPAALDSLTVLLQGHPADEAAADSLRSLSVAKFAELRRTIALRAAGGTAPAFGLLANGEGKRLMDDVRRIDARLAAREARRFVALSREQENERRAARTVLFAGIALVVLLGILGNLRIIREADELQQIVEERDAANATLQDQAAELEVANEDLSRSATTLQEQAMELEQQTEEAQALAEELELANRELNRANDELEQRSYAAAQAEAAAHAASRAKSDFLAMMSHEIRTPINAVVGYSELLALGLSGPLTDEQRSQLDRIQQSARHLLQLVNEVLDLAKIESGTLRVDAAHGRVGATADAAIDLVRAQALAKHISLSERCEGARDLWYRGDEDRVRQIVLNLLSNALKFTAPNGSVTVHAAVTAWPAGLQPSPADTESCVALSVSDTGIGIAPEHMSRIFEPFTQIETDGRNPYTREQSGTGLGLPISRQLATLMGGALTVESRLGGGSRFTLWLPLSEPAEALAAPGKAASV